LIAGAAVVFFATATSRPRSGLLLGVLLVTAALFLKGWRSRPERRGLVVWTAIGGVAILGAALTTVRPLRETLARFGEFSGRPGAVLTGGHFRPLQHRVAWLMVADRPWLGWGGGSYLYLSPLYVERVPALMQVLREQRQNHRPVFSHADGDWLEFIVEYGLTGAALLATVAVSWAAWTLKRIRRLGTEPLVLAAGAGVVLAQATIDPVLRSPAVLSALVAVAWLVVTMAHAEEATGGG
jgi:O-antigen ligase